MPPHLLNNLVHALTLFRLSREEREAAYNKARERIFGKDEKCGDATPGMISHMRQPLYKLLTILVKIPKMGMRCHVPAQYQRKIGLARAKGQSLLSSGEMITRVSMFDLNIPHSFLNSRCRRGLLHLNIRPWFLSSSMAVAVSRATIKTRCLSTSVHQTNNSIKS